ncbi:MAG: hypothetical protein H6807_03665 [Planctomycetes bacterium]|nr:hypothetical protein [Planctomycetota bacterium]
MIDPFDSKSTKKSRNPGLRPAPPIDGVEIDAMLDRIDSVLSGRDEPGSGIFSVTREEGQLAILTRLRDLAEELGRLRIVADDCGDPEAAAFAREAHARVEGLIARKSSNERSASGTIEVETDYPHLHEFMLDPALERIPL